MFKSFGSAVHTYMNSGITTNNTTKIGKKKHNLTNLYRWYLSAHYVLTEAEWYPSNKDPRSQDYNRLVSFFIMRTVSISPYSFSQTQIGSNCQPSLNILWRKYHTLDLLTWSCTILCQWTKDWWNVRYTIWSWMRRKL